MESMRICTSLRVPKCIGAARLPFAVNGPASAPASFLNAAAPFVRGSCAFSRPVVWIALTGAIICSAGFVKAEAVTIVNWTNSEKTAGNLAFNGTATTGNFTFIDGGSSTPSQRTIRPFSESERLSPFSTSPTGETRTFFGGYQTVWVGGSSGNPRERAEVRNVTGDPITVVTLANASLPSGLQGINVWLASSFLDFDATTESVALTAGSQLRMVFSADGAATTPTFRFAVKQGGQYYLSQLSYSPGTHLLSDPSAATLWAPYDPAVDLNFDAASATFSARSFTNVEAVGTYYGLAESAVNNRVGYRLSEFSATAVVVPEPGTLAIAAWGSFAAGLYFRRRRRLAR